MRSLSRLTLGTAQLGQEYGIANRSGAPDLAEASAILDAAWSGGVTAIDTARHYGEAESRIGTWIRATGRSPVVISKFPSLRDLGDDQAAAAVEASCDDSLGALRLSSIDVYLAHDAADLTRPTVLSALRRLVDRGSIGGFGVSAYDGAEIEAALAVEGMVLVQAPLSVLDRRLADSGLIARCADRGVAFCARSVFLQGLFFLDPDGLPAPLEPARQAIGRLAAIAGEAGVSVATLALATVAGEPGVASTVIGVDRASQLAEHVQALAADIPAELIAEACRCGHRLPAAVLDPRRWPPMLDARRRRG